VYCALSEGTILPFGFVFGSAACTVAYFSSKDQRYRVLYLLLSSAVLFFLRIPFDGAYVIEAAAASVLFIVTPEKVKKYVIGFLSGSGEPIYDNAIKKGVSAQLHLASSAVEEVSNALTAVCAGLDRGLPSARGEVFSRVTGELCSGCPNYEHCWLECREKTVGVFDELFSSLKENEYVDYQNMSASARNRCIKGVQLARAFNLSFQNYNAESMSKQEKNEMRRTVAEQFYSVGDIIDDIAEGLEENYYPLETLGETISVACYSFGIKSKRVLCKKGENGRLKIEIECEQIEKEFSRTLFKEKMEAICSKQLELPVLIRGEKSDCIRICEKHALGVEVGTSQIASNGEKLCGDSFEHFYDGRGSFDVVLADGMGTGPRAALDSAMARGLTQTLLEKGISPRGTIRLVNSALMVKSPEESMSSLDIMQVDMFSGKTEFFKAGAAASFVRHKGRVQEIKKPAMPLGILHRVEFASLRGVVSCGDIAVLVSDGIADCGADFVRDILRNNASLPSEEIAVRLTEKARKIGGEKHDDLTAVVCKFF
jgi:stage II sporulation protein E